MKRAMEQAGLFDSIVVDLFAGLGGASIGIERGLMRSGHDRPIDVAINHSPIAVACHIANHPRTRHLMADVFDVDPVMATGGRPVSLLWASPDCRHFSRAKGGKPVSKRVRSLAWVVVRWAKAVRPEQIMLENVEEFQTWGPLGSDARPCPKRKGATFRRWVKQLEMLGYRVEWRALKACDYGSPTIRKRLYLIARCDGLPIVWPEPTHGPGTKRQYRTAAQCINWSLPFPSIFLTRYEARAAGCKRPLAEATLRRIANGVWRYVINAKQPFIVRTGHWSNITGKGKGFRGQSPDKPLSTIHCTNDYGMVVPSLVGVGGRAGQSRPRGVDEPTATATTKADTAVVAPLIAPLTHRGKRRCNKATEPLPTITGAHRGEQAVVSASLIANTTGNGPASVDDPLKTVTTGWHHGLLSATLVGAGGPVYSGKPAAVDRPMGSQTTENHRAVAAVLLGKYNGHTGNEVVCNSPAEPLRTQTTDNRHAVVAAQVCQIGGTNRSGCVVDEPFPTVTGGGTHLGEVRKFMCAYYGNEKEGQSLREPLRTATAKERFGLVMIDGEPHEVVDIGIRMLSPRELARAQGFPDEYQIDAGPSGRTLTKTEQVRLIGNSVCPQVAEAIVAANYRESVRAVEVSA